MQFQLDGIVEVRLGVHGCQRHGGLVFLEDVAAASVSPWHAWAPFVPTVVYCSVALVQNAALQICRAVKGSDKSTAAVSGK
jgi:hypothetical protein